ncbi:MAG: PaaI family thioesterase [Paracoccaceae bacterium]
MTTEPDWRQIGHVGFNAHFGPLDFARTGDSSWQASLELQDHHLNRGGVCHGGVYMSLADVAMGAAAYEAAGEKACATIDFKAHFLAAAKRGQTLLADARLNRLVSGIAFMECTITAGGRTCLTANGIWKYLKSERADRVE